MAKEALVNFTNWILPVSEDPPKDPPSTAYTCPFHSSNENQPGAKSANKSDTDDAAFEASSSSIPGMSKLAMNSNSAKESLEQSTLNLKHTLNLLVSGTEDVPQFMDTIMEDDPSHGPHHLSSRVKGRELFPNGSFTASAFDTAIVSSTLSNPVETVVKGRELFPNGSFTASAFDTAIVSSTLSNPVETVFSKTSSPRQKLPPVFKTMPALGTLECSPCTRDASQAKFPAYFKIYKIHDRNTANAFHVCVENETSKEGKIVVRHQVAFLMDATASMDPYIQGTKDQICKLMETLRASAQEEVHEKFSAEEANVDFIFEVAVVCYRDFGDDCHFETMDFSTNMESVKSFLEKVCATQGGDAPEDVQGAFIHALFGISNTSLKLSWERHGGCASRSILWLADAPPHGQEMGRIEFCRDRFPKVDMEEWKSLFAEMARLNVDLNIIRINADCDETHKIMKTLGDQAKMAVTVLDVAQSFAGCERKIPTSIFADRTAKLAHISSVYVFYSPAVETDSLCKSPAKSSGSAVAYANIAKEMIGSVKKKTASSVSSQSMSYDD